jgi:hypothetical protein
MRKSGSYKREDGETQLIHRTAAVELRRPLPLEELPAGILSTPAPPGAPTRRRQVADIQTTHYTRSETHHG